MSLRGLTRAAATTAHHLARLGTSSPSIVFLNKRWAHHGRHSGYLIDEGIGPTLARSDRFLPYPLVKRWERVTDDPHLEERWLLWMNLAVARARLLHLVDGDFDGWAYRRRPPLLSTGITATFHQPTDRLEAIAKGLSLGALDGVICVSRDQIPLLEPFVPAGRCQFIPHGVDTDFFLPASPYEPESPPVLLAVGSHRRDLVTLVAAARLIRARRPDVVVRLISSEDQARWVAENGADAVEVKFGLSDEELRAQYQRATMLFLPLEASTANNALLEAMACGLAAVITDLPGIRDYASPSSAIFCALADPEMHAEAALQLLDDQATRREMGTAGHSLAQDLSWPRVRGQAQAFMRGVIDNLSNEKER